MQCVRKQLGVAEGPSGGEACLVSTTCLQATNKQGTKAVVFLALILTDRFLLNTEVLFLAMANRNIRVALAGSGLRSVESSIPLTHTAVPKHFCTRVHFFFKIRFYRDPTNFTRPF